MQRARRVAACLFLGGILVLCTPLAVAQEVGDGCRARLNGKPARALTEQDPLEIGPNERIRVDGDVAGSGRVRRTTTRFYLLLYGIRVPLEAEKGLDRSRWGGRVEVPDLLKTLAAGTYRVEVEATGEPTGFRCEASAYIDLRGGSLTIALGFGALLVGVGAAATLGARGTAANAPDKGTIARKTGIDDRRVTVAADVWITRAVDLAYLGAIVVALYLVYEDVVQVSASLAAAARTAPAPKSRRVWVRGRAGRGFVGGLFLGAGATLILHQLGIGTLDISDGLALPALVAMVSMARAWIGSAFLVTPPADNGEKV